MIIALYIVNGLLALVFLATGGMKVVRSRAALAAAGMTWTTDSSSAQVKLVGALEVLGALGLILPLATGIAPILTPIAAIGLAVVMVGAVVVHMRHKESPLPPAVVAVIAIASAALGFLAL